MEKYLRPANENHENVAEMARIKAQLFRRVSEAMKRIPGVAGNEPPCFGSRIPEKLLPKRLSGHLVVDVAMLKGEIFTHLIINAEGYVIDREHQKGEKEVPPFRAENVYALRVRSGFFGRMGLMPWISICG